MIFVVILSILIIFSTFFAVIWLWFFKNENSTSPQEKYKKALKAFSKGNYKKAKELFIQVVDLDANFKDVQYNLGSCLLRLAEYDNAKSCFEAALKNSPKNFDILLNIAQTLQKQKKYDEAEEYYTKAIDENDKNFQSYLGLGILNCDKQDYNKALEYLEKAKTLAPDNIQILFYIAKCKAELCDFDINDDCQAIINEYLSMSDKKDLPAEFNVSLARIYAKSGQIAKALEFAKKALNNDSEDVEAYKLLGLIQLIKKEFVDAKGTLSTALHLQPKNQELQEILSYLLCQQDDSNERKRCREKYHEMIKKYSGKM